MVNEDCEDGSSSRRGLLRAAGAGLAGLALAGCGTQSLKAQVHNSAPVLGTDVGLLNQLLHLEHVAIAAYTAGTPLLAPATYKAGRLFLNDELSHAGELAGLVKAAGGEPIKPAPSYALGHPRTSDEVLRLLHEIENMQLRAYLAAITQLEPGSVKQAIGSILANDAQHVAGVASQLARLGAPAPTAPLSLKAASDVLGQHDVSASLTDVHTQNDCLKLLVDLESVAEGASYTPIRDLSRPDLVRMCAEIMACEAQHWTVLSGLRNPGQYVKAVPWPYVFGSK